MTWGHRRPAAAGVVRRRGAEAGRRTRPPGTAAPGSGTGRPTRRPRQGSAHRPRPASSHSFHGCRRTMRTSNPTRLNCWSIGDLLASDRWELARARTTGRTGYGPFIGAWPGPGRRRHHGRRSRPGRGAGCSIANGSASAPWTPSHARSAASISGSACAQALSNAAMAASTGGEVGRRHLGQVRLAASVSRAVRRAAARPASVGARRRASGSGRGSDVVRLISATSLRTRRIERRIGNGSSTSLTWARVRVATSRRTGLCRGEGLAHASPACSTIGSPRRHGRRAHQMRVHQPASSRKVSAAWRRRKVWARAGKISSDAARPTSVPRRDLHESAPRRPGAPRGRGCGEQDDDGGQGRDAQARTDAAMAANGATAKHQGAVVGQSEPGLRDRHRRRRPRPRPRCPPGDRSRRR